MSSILGLGPRGLTPSQLRAQEEKKTEKMKENQGKVAQNFDSYTPSTFAMTETQTETDETLFDHMGVEVSDVGSEDFEVEQGDIQAEDVEIEEEDADIEVEEGDIETEELDFEENMSATAPTRVHGYVSSLTDEDRAMLSAAYQGFQALKLEGTSLFDYMGDTSGWFESAASSPSTYDTSSWDLSAFEEYFANLGNDLSEETDSTETEEVETQEVYETEEE